MSNATSSASVRAVIACLPEADKHATVAFVDVLAVQSQFQGRGYGREMLRATMDYFRGRGAKYINLDCLTDNDKGNSLYRAEGFEEVARHIRWFRNL